MFNWCQAGPAFPTAFTARSVEQLIQLGRHAAIIIIIITSLPEVIWEEGHVTVLSHTYTVKSPWLQWRAPNSPPKVPLPVDRSPNPITCLIPGPVRPTMPNGIRIRSAVFPQCTGQTDARTDRRTDRPTDRPRASLKIIGRCATRATRPNNNVRLSWLENAYSRLPFVTGDFDRWSTSDWSSLWCATSVH